MFKLLLCLILIQHTVLDVQCVFGSSGSVAPQLTENERSWLKAHPTIRLAPDPEFQPIEFFDINGNYSGIGADYARLIGQKLGINFEIVQYSTWDEVLTRIKRREVDVLNAVVKTPQRESFLEFPSPYLRIPSVIIVRNNVTSKLTLDMLNGMHVVMVSGYGYVDLIRNEHPAIEIELVSDLKSALRKVSFGMVDAFVGDLATASFYIESEKITNLKLAGESDPPNISGFAVRSDWPELCRILEKGVAMLSEEEQKAIHNKWIHLQSAPGLTTEEFQNLALFTVAIIILIVGGFLLWNRMLTRMVGRRTRALSIEIEERKKTQQALILSEKRFKDLCENSTDWIWEFDENEIFTFASKSIETLLGYTPEEVLGKSPFDLIPQADQAQVRKEFSLVREVRMPFSNLLNINQHKNGSKVILESSGVPIIDSNGVFRGYRGIDRDITERKKMEEELRQAQKMESIGTLAGGIAHDFNNILTAIMGYTELAKDDVDNPVNLHKDLSEVLHAAYRAKELVQQILTFSRKTEQQLQPIRIQSVSTEALKLLRSSIPTTIEIRQDIDSNCRAVLADSTQIHQVIMNLCTNAYHAMRDTGGTLTLSVQEVRIGLRNMPATLHLKTGTYVKLEISDTGIGMEKYVQERIFEPYYSTKEKGEGTGLGLAVVHGIIASLEGDILVHSQLGSGTTFTIYLPVVKIQDNILQEAEFSTQLPTGSEHILLVDDDAVLVALNKTFLNKLGYTVTEQTSSEKALELFQKNFEAFDLVITDMTMPKITGNKLAQQFLTIRSNIPIILCTGYSEMINEEQAKALGIREYIMKPASHKDLAFAVRRVLDCN